LLFIGEDRIDHTPKDEFVTVKIGNAFDVVSERKQTDYKSLGSHLWEMEYEITIRNHKDMPITVQVNEPIGGDWEMLNSTYAWTKTAAFAAQFIVPVRGARVILARNDGEKLFTAKFTIEEGAGRPLTKGTGAPLSDPNSRLVFPRNFDRLSSPDSNSCVGCHNSPAQDGGGDRVTEVFVLAQRFDHLTFDYLDAIETRGAMDEPGKIVTMDTADVGGFSFSHSAPLLRIPSINCS
jgi:hypothetical protein